MAPADTYDDVCRNYGAWIQAYQVKEIQRTFGVAEPTAKKWRNGCLPESRQLVAMMERWGVAFEQSVFGPALGTQLSIKGSAEIIRALSADMERQIRDAENRLIRAGVDFNRGRVDQPDSGAVAFPPLLSPVPADRTDSPALRSIGAVFLVLASLAMLGAHNDAMARTRTVRGRVEMIAQEVQ